MKKIISLLLVLVLGISLAACSGNGTTTTTTTAAPTSNLNIPEDAYIALVTDVGNIDDKSFNQGTWEGVVKFAEDNNVEHKYYRPAEDSDEARIETMKTAIDNGATVVVCPGYMFAAAAAAVTVDYPDVSFIFPDVGEYNLITEQKMESIPSNVAAITYQEEQAGYLAGYAAVKDGFTKLGFLGGMDVPAVIRYGFGYVQGADAAAKEMGKTSDVSIKYWYSGSFAPTDDIQTKMSGWYTEGTEIVFACGGGIYLSAVNAADAADAKVIGVDVDQYAVSDRIITSAMKELGNSVITALTALYTDTTWSFGGKETVLGAANNGVGLPTAETSWRLTTFTVAEYETLFNKLKSGEVTVSNDIENKPTVSIAVDYQG